MHIFSGEYGTAALACALRQVFMDMDARHPDYPVAVCKVPAA